MPELREAMFYARVFLSRRPAAFELGAAATALALLARSPLLLAGWVPYGRMAWREVRSRGRRQGLEALAVGAAADAVGLAAMLRGSLRYRSALLKAVRRLVMLPHHIAVASRGVEGHGP